MWLVRNAMQTKMQYKQKHEIILHNYVCFEEMSKENVMEVSFTEASSFILRKYDTTAEMTV